MESRVSSNSTRNIYRPSTPEKEVNRKENTMGKIARRWQIRKFTHSQIYILAKFIFAGSLNIFVPFLVPVDKKIHSTKFEIEEENTKLPIARKPPL